MRPGTLAVVAVWFVVWGVVAGQVSAEEPPAGYTEADIVAAWAKAERPTRVSLKLENVSPREACEKLATATRHVIQVPKADLPQAQPVTLTAENEAFWPVFERLAAQAPAEVGADSLGTPAVQWGFGLQDASPFVAMIGPARIRLTSFQMGKGVEQKLRHEEPAAGRLLAVTLGFLVDVEPWLLVKLWGIELTSVVDSTGRELVPATVPGGDAPGPRPGNERSCWNGRLIAGQTTVPIMAPSCEAQSLRSVRGVLRLTMFPALPPIRCPVPCAAPLAVRCGPQTVTFESVWQLAGGGWSATFLVEPLADWREYLNLLGQARLVMVDGPAVPPGKCAGPERDDQPARFVCKFGDSGQHRATAIEVPAPVASQTEEFAFAFRDLPLPPRESCCQATRVTDVVAAPEPPATIAIPPGVYPLAQLAPSTFTRQGADVPLAELVRDLMGQTGNPVELQLSSEHPVTVRADFEKTPFCQVLGRLADQPWVAVEHEFAEPPRVIITAGQQPAEAVPRRPLAFVRDVGRFRLAVMAVAVRADCRMRYSVRGDRATDRLTLTLYVNAVTEPRLRVISSGLSIEECRTNDGRDLVFRLPEPFADPVERYPGDQQESHGSQFRGGTWAALAQDFRLTDGRLPTRLTRVRCYYSVLPYWGEKEITVTDLAQPSVHPIDEASTLNWKGLVVRNGESALEFIITGSGRPYPPLEARWLNRGEWLLAGDGRAENRGSWRWLGDNGWRFSFRNKTLPAKVVLKFPTGAREHAGVIEFRDIPVPALP